MRPHLPLTMAFAILLGIPPAHAVAGPTPASEPSTSPADSIRYAT